MSGPTTWSMLSSSTTVRPEAMESSMDGHSLVTAGTGRHFPISCQYRRGLRVWADQNLTRRRESTTRATLFSPPPP